MKWKTGEDSEEFVAFRKLDTQEPCSCAIFTANRLIVGCHKFLQIDLQTYFVNGKHMQIHNKIIYYIELLNLNFCNFSKINIIFIYKKYNLKNNKVINAFVEFPEEDNSSIKEAISGAAKVGVFPVCILNIANTHGPTELLLCYNKFGVFVNENGRRTRAVDPEWNDLPFAFGRYYTHTTH